MPSQTTNLEGLLEALPDALLGVDAAGMIRFVNHQAESLFGYERGDLVGLSIETLVPTSFRRAHARHREHFNASSRTRPLGTDLNLIALRRDGTTFPVDISLGHLDTEDGALVIASVRDITDRRRQEADRHRLSQLAAATEFSGEAVSASTPEGIITSWNPAAEKLSGWSSEEIVGKPVAILSPEEGAPDLARVLSKISAGEPVERMETISVRKDGTRLPLSMALSPIHAEDGSIVGAVMSAHDATREQHELELAQRGAAIVQSSQVAIISTSLEGSITSWNPAAELTFGWSGEEIVGRPVSLLQPDDRADELRDVMARVSAAQPVEHFETARVRKDGTTLPVSVTISPVLDADGAIVGASASMRDLSEQTRTFESARSMIEASLDSMVSITPEGKIADANLATVELTGIPREELIGTSFSDYFTDPGKAEDIYQQVVNRGMARDYPLTIQHRNHRRLTQVLYNASVYRDGDGKVLGVFAAARDVTRQIQAQNKIAHQQAQALERVAELERFQRLTVGRELKMIELKKELEQFRRQGAARGGEPGEQH